MKTFPASIAICVGAGLLAPVARASSECPAYIPAGVVIRMLPDEKLVAGSSSGPTIFSVSSDLRFFPNRPPLLARGSKVLGTIIESKEAGRIVGKARLKITLQSILTSDLCEYPVDAKVVEAGRHKIKDEVVVGKGHAGRDTMALLFPPTTIYQLIRIPSRGPRLVLDNETPLNIKLLQPVSLAETPTRLSENDQSEAVRTKVDQIERELSVMKSALRGQSSLVRKENTDRGIPARCSAAGFVPAVPIVRSTTILRPVRNLTSYHVSLYVDNKPVLILPPCSGPSMIATPAAEFRIEAIANLLTAGGQKQIAMKVIPSTEDKGWDIVPEDDRPILRSN
jgi:hypothetical protein